MHDEVGDEAEIIFGAVNEPAMQGEIRVTVIATGFDHAVQSGMNVVPPDVGITKVVPPTPVLPFSGRQGRASFPTVRNAPPSEAPRRSTNGPGFTHQPDKASQDLSDMEIPTFIRRQMD